MVKVLLFVFLVTTNCCASYDNGAGSSPSDRIDDVERRTDDLFEGM